MCSSEKSCASYWVLLITVCAFAASANAPAARADATRNLERALNQSYKGKILLLRTFYGGDQLRYDSKGKLIKGGRPGPWTVDADVRITRIRLKHQRFEIDGERIWLVYDSTNKKLTGLHSNDNIVIKIDVKGSTVTMASLAEPIRRVFLGTQDKLIDLVPSYWKPFLSGDVDKSMKKVSSDGQSIEKIGGSVTAPRPIHDPDPPYSDEARAQHFSGTVLLSMVVTAQGDVGDIVIVRPAGLGLDDQAVETVSTWKFKPAMRNGIPVAVRMLAEVTFRIG